MPISHAQPLKKMVVLEEGMIIQMANNATFTKEFPFLKSVAGYSIGGCGGCNPAAGTQRTQALTAAKQTLAGMGDERKRKLLQLLNAQQARIVYKAGSRTVQLTIGS